jgi:hypothetical protein
MADKYKNRPNLVYFVDKEIEPFKAQRNEYNLMRQKKNLQQGVYNNPANIEDSKWAGGIGFYAMNRMDKTIKGKDGKTYKTKPFTIFDSPEMGYRALGRLLLNKYVGLSIEKAVKKFAPSVENKTGPYIDTLVQEVGLKDKDQLITKDNVKAVMKAITKHENKENVTSYYTDEHVEEGYRLAIKYPDIPENTSYKNIQKKEMLEDDAGPVGQMYQDIDMAQYLGRHD